MFDVFWGRHLGRSFICLRVLPEILESTLSGKLFTIETDTLGGSNQGKEKGSTHSSVAFISGHDCGEQNSVIEP